MGINIKMSSMPKGINEIIYNPGVSISTPEYVLIPCVAIPPNHPGLKRIPLSAAQYQLGQLRFVPAFPFE